MEDKTQKQMLSSAELSMFCYQFSVVFKAGIPYLEGLQLLAGDAFDGRMKGLVVEISREVDAGKMLYEAIANRKVFPEYMVSMLKIAENTGRTGDVFEQLSLYYEQNDQLKHKVRNALTYPFVLIGLMTAVILLLILKVLPIFHDILKSVGGSVPSATQFVLDFSQVLQSSFMIIIGVILILLCYFILLFKTDFLSQAKDKALLTWPILKKIYKKSILVKFSRALSILTKSGMSIQTSLDLVIPLMDNSIVAERLMVVNQKVESGIAFEVALRETNLFPELFLKMVTDRKSVVLGKSVDMGGRRFI